MTAKGDVAYGGNMEATLRKMSDEQVGAQSL
jgi:hypothetical protein